MFVAARVFNISHAVPRENGINAAKEALSAGRAVVFPTDTSYAIAVRAMDEKAVNLLWNIKGQKPKTPLKIFITTQTLALALLLSPFVIMGGIFGQRIMKHINQRAFEYSALISTLIAGLLL